MIPQSLFARTALLIAATIAVFAFIVWQAVVWTAVIPAADAAASLLAEHAHAALAARRSGAPLPEDVRFEPGDAPAPAARYAGLAVRTYVAKVLRGVAKSLNASAGKIGRYGAPSEIWLRVPEVPDAWLVLTWRIAGPAAPLATLVVLAAAALLTLGAAAFSARRLTAPLAALASAAARLAEGEGVAIAANTGPSEVRSLAVAFQSMSQRLAELDEQRELLLGGLSHDLRTPLARLRVAVELLGEGERALTDEMTANIEEMDRMIGQFLHYTRAGFRESPGRASLDEIARQTLAIYATDARVSLELAAPESRWFALDGVRHVLINVVQNALDHGRPPVTVRTASSPGEIRIDVEDRGPGLDAAEWQQALRPFHRLQAQPGGTHTGLGLAMVERLVRVSGGSLDARRVPGGFVVTVRLPAQEAAG